MVNKNLRDTFYSDACLFLERLSKTLELNKINLLSHWNVDHLCYRTQTQDAYLAATRELSTWSRCLIESEVNGRLISTFKLEQPIVWGVHSIDLVEVPAPKQGKYTPTGFEHVEVVSDLTFEELLAKYGSLSVDKRGLQKPFNQELEINFGDSALKFHQLSLESVVTFESQNKIFEALSKSNILKTFKSLNPLVAGTFPLGISTSRSDIDILLQARELNALANELENKFRSQPGFKIHHTVKKQVPSLVCSFEFENVPFELFAQDVPTVSQTAFKHFQIEERLLKLGGRHFRDKITDIRRTGIKTEPAFAQALNLTGDPYDALLELHKASETQLDSLLAPFKPSNQRKV